MGIHKEVRKMFGSSVLNYVIAARTAQGYDDFKSSTPEERQDIISRWNQEKTELQNQRQNILDMGGPEGQETGRLSPKGFFQTRHLSFDERKRLHEERKTKREAERNKVQSKDGRQSCPFCRRDKPHTHTPRAVQETPAIPHDADETNAEFEEAIHDSVAATSRGDPEEDLMIERAIRASVRELQKSSSSKLTDQEALHRAIQASVAEAGRGRSSDHVTEHTEATADDAEHQALLEKAIKESLASHQLSSPPNIPDDVDTDEDENVKLALQRSKQQSNKDRSSSDNDDEDIKLALHNSKEEIARARTEEEIVLEYVKKQSLAEEEHKRAVQREKEPDSKADEEALKQAIEESLASAGGRGGSGGEASGS